MFKIRDEIGGLNPRMGWLGPVPTEQTPSLGTLGISRPRATTEEAEGKYPTDSRAVARLITAPIAADAFIWTSMETIPLLGGNIFL